MKLTRNTALIALGTIALVGALVLTGFRGMGGHCHRDMSPERMQQMATIMVDNALDKIDATDAQRTQIQVIKDRMLERGMSLRDEHKDARTQALRLWESDQPDLDQVHAMVDNRVDTMRTFAHEAADAILELHGILTPEQRALVAEQVRENRMHE